MKSRPFALILTCITLLLVALPLTTLNTTHAYQEAATIGLSLPNSSGVFYEALTEGAQTAADKLGVKLVVVSADDSAETELANMESLIEQGVDAVLLSPTDPSLSLKAIKAANAAGIPVFVLGNTPEAPEADSAENAPEVAGLITVDNVKAGEMAATVLCEAVANSGTVALLTNVPEAAADEPESAEVTAARERFEGFNNYMAENCPQTVLKTVETVDLEHDAVVSMFADLLKQGEIAGVFGSDDQLLAAMEASIIARKNGIIFVGFGATEDAIAAIQQGRLKAVITPDAWLLGQTAVETSAGYLSGETVSDSVNVDLAVLNMDSLEVFRCSPARGCSRND